MIQLSAGRQVRIFRKNWECSRFLLIEKSGDNKTIISSLFTHEAEILSDELIVVTEEKGSYYISQFPVKTEITKQNSKIAPLEAIILLDTDTNNSFGKLSGKDVVVALMNNIYPCDLNDIDNKNLFPEKLRIISRIVDCAAVYEIKYRNIKYIRNKIFQLEYAGTTDTTQYSQMR